jgi:hypothetical protein
MKKLILVVALTLSSLTFGQNRKGSEGTPEQIAEIQTKRLTLDLDLNTSQQKDIKALLLEQAEKRKAILTEIKTNREQNKIVTTEEKHKRQIEALDNQIELKSKLKKVLTPEQMKKWEAKQEERKIKIAKMKRKTQSREQ